MTARFNILNEDGTIDRDVPFRGFKLRKLKEADVPEGVPAAVRDDLWIEVHGGRSSGGAVRGPTAGDSGRVVPSGPNGTMTRAKARVALRQAGIHPYPKDVDNFLASRRLTSDERARHSKKIADKVRKGIGMDDIARREVEGG